MYLVHLTRTLLSESDHSLPYWIQKVHDKSQYYSIMSANELKAMLYCNTTIQHFCIQNHRQ